MSHETSAPRLLQSRLMPPESCDFVWDFLAKQIMAPSPATEGDKGHSELQCATFRGSTKWYLVTYRSALFNPAGGYEKYVVESSAARSTPWPFGLNPPVRLEPCRRAGLARQRLSAVREGLRRACRRPAQGHGIEGKVPGAGGDGGARSSREVASASNSGRPEGARERPPKERPASAFPAWLRKIRC